MPSTQLSLLCNEIEQQYTDHFGKFYMYVSLLNTLVVRTKTFADGLPKYHKGFAFWRTNNLNLGEVSVEFTRQLNLYTKVFINTQPHWSTALYNVLMNYIRKGNITDLMYIIDKMLDHLDSIHEPLSHNQEVYKYIGFDQRKGDLRGFIKQVSALNQQLLLISDSGCNTALSVGVMLVGLTVILASVFSLIPGIIGLGLIVAGAGATYYYLTELEAQAEDLKQCLKELSKSMEQLPTDTSLFGDDKNFNEFYNAVVKPLPYAGITAIQQLVFDEEQWNAFERQREDMDRAFATVSI